MADIDNLEAWAATQGYDPKHDYVGEQPLQPGFVSPHFREAEFACNHCGELASGGIPQELINVLEQVRAHYNQPVTINSGYRCPTHNANVGGATNSQHLLGTAADIVVKNVSPSKVYADLDPYHDGGLGKYGTFTHIDVRGSRARWSG